MLYKIIKKVSRKELVHSPIGLGIRFFLIIWTYSTFQYLNEWKTTNSAYYIDIFVNNQFDFY